MKKYFLLLSAALALSFPAMAEDTALQPSSYIFNISYEDAEDAISKALTEKLIQKDGRESKDGQSISASINGSKITPLYSSNKPVNVEIRGLRAESANNRWSANMVITAEDKVISALPLSGRYMVMNEVPVLKRSIRNGELISEADIEIKPFPEVRSGSDTISDISDLIGKTPVHSISPSRPIKTTEISAPYLIKKNSLVQMRYKTPAMEITTTGLALEGGLKGDVIEVRNTSSKKTIRAIVTDSNTVDILPPPAQASQVASSSPSVKQESAKSDEKL
jgi:flagella basal body P-ring formation protein FlgA